MKIDREVVCRACYRYVWNVERRTSRTETGEGGGKLKGRSVGHVIYISVQPFDLISARMAMTAPDELPFALTY